MNDFGSPKSYYLHTFGCQMNENDSEKLAGILESAGFVESKKRKDADLIIFNTCCVRENAEKKFYGHLGALKNLKIENPDLVIAVCGCMMNQESAAAHILKTYKHVDIIFGNNNQHKFLDMLHRVYTDRRTIYETDAGETTITETVDFKSCLLYTSPSPRDRQKSRMPSSA